MNNINLLEYLAAYSLITGIILGLALNYMATRNLLRLKKEFIELIQKEINRKPEDEEL